MINRLERYDLNCSVFNSYDYDDCLDLNSLLCRFFTKINECIEASNKSLTFLEWLHEVGLKQEVVTLLTQWKDDGTLANLISDQLLTEINKNIENNTTLITGVRNDFKNFKEKVNEKLDNLALYPTKLEGEEDYTQAFTRCIDLIKRTGGGSIILGQGKVYEGNMLIDTGNIRIKGDGILKGKIEMKGIPTDNLARYTGTGDIRIEGITIDGEMNRNGLEMEWVFGVTIKNTCIKNCIKAIKFNNIDATQHISRVEIISNSFIDNNYTLFSDSERSSFHVGDVTFNDNVCESRDERGFTNIYHCYLKSLDGFVCEGNTFFFANNPVVQTNIFIDNFNWTIITGNNIFVPNEHCINISNGSNLNIESNNFAWSEKEAIVINNIISINVIGNNITWKDQTNTFEGLTAIKVINCRYGLCNILGNAVKFPNEYFVNIINSSHLNISNNTVLSKNAKKSPFNIEGKCEYIVITDNLIKGFPTEINEYVNLVNSEKTIHFSGNTNGYSPQIFSNIITSPSYKTYTRNETSIDINDSDLIIFANSSTTTINQININDIVNSVPRIIKIYSYNSNTKLSRTIPNIHLKGNGVTVDIPGNNSIELLVYGGSIRELNRSFPVT